MEVVSKNVGRIAERIAMNELEARGFHIIDLAYMSKTSINVDFIASKGGDSFNVQVKGASNSAIDPRNRWGIQYGFCTDEVISKERTMFNGTSDAALQADIVVLLAVRSPSLYRAIVLPIAEAERAAQLNLDAYYRKPSRAGGRRKAGIRQPCSRYSSRDTACSFIL